MQTHRCSARSTIPTSPPCGLRLQAPLTSSKDSTLRHHPRTASKFSTNTARTEVPISSSVSPPSTAAAAAAASSHSKLCMDLFDDSHVTWTPALILYFPLGCVLALARICLWIAGIALDLQGFKNPAIVSMYLRLLGVKVVWNNVERVPTGGSHL